jgi:hypothetical protein
MHAEVSPGEGPSSASDGYEERTPGIAGWWASVKETGSGAMGFREERIAEINEMIQQTHEPAPDSSFHAHRLRMRI